MNGRMGGAFGTRSRRSAPALRRDARPQDLRNRLSAYAGLMLFVLLVLLGRLWVLQVVRGEEYAREAQSNHLKQREIPAPRGSIYDADGHIMELPTHLRDFADPEVRDDDHRSKILVHRSRLQVRRCQEEKLETQQICQGERVEDDQDIDRHDARDEEEPEWSALASHGPSLSPRTPSLSSLTSMSSMP